MTTTTTTARIPEAWEALPDEEVVRRVLEGEGALFELLMRRYNQRLYRVARAIVRDEAEAEDVMQQAYVSAYTHLAQFERRARFSTWLTRIAVHEALARRRRRERITEMDAMPETGGELWTSKGPDPEQQALTGELRRALEASVDALPESHRSVFVLRDVEGLSTAETAECLGLSEDNVKTRPSRSRAMLRRELLARAGGATPDVFSFHLSRCDRVVAAVLERLGLRAAAGTPPPRG
jgi:RNA polymerase sigma-70 factor, ECF subfamily